MSSVQEIEAAIERLSKDEFWRLSDWVLKRREGEWGRQVEADAAAGKLDFLFAEADAEKREGLLKPWPPATA